MPERGPPVANFLWIGTELGAIHAACLRSFLRHGYRVVLHAFDDIADAPKGVVLYDASRLMDRSEIVRYRNGHLALTANIYRLRILQAGMGPYFDCDIFCVKPAPDTDYLFGWEDDTHINNAVLNLPAGSPLLKAVIAAAEDRMLLPPWYAPSRKRRMRFRRLLTGRPTISDMEWGTTGPKLLTYFAKKLGLDGLAQPIDVFYPLHFRHKQLLNTPGLTLADITTSRTAAVHLCASVRLRSDIHPGSILHQMIGE